MTTHPSSDRVGYLESKVAFVEGTAERWLKAHREAEACWAAEDLVRDAVRLIEDILRLDREIRGRYCDGAAWDAALDAKVDELFGRWHRLAASLERHAAGIESDGYRVEKLGELRGWVEEVGAMLAPSGDLGAGPAGLRDAALEEHAGGGTVEWERD